MSNAPSVKYGGRSVARLSAVQGVYQQTLHAGEALFIPQDDEMIPRDEPFFRILIEGTLEHRTSLDKIIQKFLPPEWPFARLEVLIRSILEVGLFEISHFKDVDLPILLNEYVEIAYSFYGSKEVSFINGILNNAGKHIRL